MKNILCVIWFAIATSFLFETSWAYGVQEWGYHDHRTVLAYEYTERLAKGLRYVDLKFPYIVSTNFNFWQVCRIKIAFGATSYSRLFIHIPVDISFFWNISLN